MLYNYWQRHTCNIPLYETARRRQLATIITAAAQQHKVMPRAGADSALDMVTGTEQSLAPCLDSEAGSKDLPGHCPWSAALEDTAETARHHCTGLSLIFIIILRASAAINMAAGDTNHGLRRQ